MSHPPTELEDIFLTDRPLIDVRAPVEFARGALPNAVNLPLLNDEERRRVGICHKHSGPEAATQLGHKLVSGEVKSRRMDAWMAYLSCHPAAMIYCFRGGLRSRIVSEWLQAEGQHVPRIDGGYKTIRRFLQEQFHALPPLMLVSGQTGAGKTLLLQRFNRKVDLEALAQHRGSAFGKMLEPQPAQADFENAVAIALLRLGRQGEVLLEDEARLIGRIHLPPPLQSSMAKAPLLVIEEPLAHRVDHIFDEYITAQWHEYLMAFGDAGFAAFSDYLLNALDAIRKRLGNLTHRKIRDAMQSALTAQHNRNDLTDHKQWIAALLLQYYDPMYDYQLANKVSRVRFQGDRNGVAEWYLHHSSTQDQ